MFNLLPFLQRMAFFLNQDSSNESEEDEPITLIYCFNLTLEQNKIYNWINQYFKMLSTTQATMAFYNNIITTPELLANGYEIIRTFLFDSQKNRTETLMNILHPSIPILSLIINIYPNEVFTSPLVSSSQKQETRTFLANLLASEIIKRDDYFNAKSVNLLFSFLHKIHNIEGFTDWVLKYQQSLSALVQNQSSRFGFFVLNILKEADDRVNQLSRHILGLVIGSDWIPNPEEQLEITYYLYKSLAILNETDSETIQEYVTPFIKPTVSYVMSHMKHSIKSMKFSLKILTLLLGDYNVECFHQLQLQIEKTTGLLIIEYLNYLNNGSINKSQNIELQEEDEVETIEVALYQLLQLFLTLFENDVALNNELIIYLCIISTFLGERQYKQYISKSDSYIIDVEDEGDTNIRNKSIYFLQEMIECKQRGKKCKKMLMDYIDQILTDLTSVRQKVSAFLQSHQLPMNLLNIHQIYIESALFILYSFTEDLIKSSNTNAIMATLGNQIKASPPNSIDTILSILIINKLMKNQQKSQKQIYLTFVRGFVLKFANNIGMLIALMRSIYSFSAIQNLTISTSGIDVPSMLVQKLLAYVLRNDSSQRQSGYLILQFLLHLLKCQSNKPILQHLLTHENQIYLFKTFVHDSISSSVVTDLIAKLQNKIALELIYNEVQNGYASDENYATLIGKCMRSKTLHLTQQQIIRLYQIYSKKIDLVADIITAFAEDNALTDQVLIAILNSNLNSKWLPCLLKQNKLYNIRDNFLGTVRNITNVIASPHQLESNLLLPYSIILRNPSESIELLNQEGLLFGFYEKVFKYAKLFKGAHLKMITAHIFIATALIRREMVPSVIELCEGFGKIEVNQWQEVDQQDEGQDTFINRIMSDIVNEQVQQTFKNTFGQLCWNSSLLQSKIHTLKTL